MTKKPASWRPFGELATSWFSKLREDIFFKTEVIIIGTLFFLCFANVAIIAVAFSQLHIDIATSVIGNISEAIAKGDVAALNATSTSENVFNDLTTVRNTYLTIIAGISIIVTLLFGYVVARIALAPAHNALASQKQFIGNIAHELRTPLSIIKANNEIMMMQQARGIDTAAMIASNIEELDRISGIINNLLTLNTFRQVQHMNFQFLQLGDIVKDAVHKFEKLASSRGVALQIDIDDERFVWGNKSGLAQIAMNLVKNAITYTPAGGVVRVRTYHSNEKSVALEVSDDGIGIERHKLRRIFEPFYQVDPSRAQNAGSSGLGLAIVSELVKFHHGKISIQSTPSVGTTVRVDLPAQEQPQSIHPGARTEHNGHAEIEIDFSR